MKVVNFFTEINHKFCKHNARVSKYRVTAQLWSGHVRSDLGKSERFEEQQSLYTVGGPAGYLCSATVGRSFVDFVRHM